MADFAAVYTSFTPTATADGNNLADATYVAIKGGSATQRVRIKEVVMGGQASSSAVNTAVLGADSTVGATLSSSSILTSTIHDSSGGNLSTMPTVFNTATTKPQRSATLKYLALPFNAFGGFVQWAVSPVGQGPTILGNTASLGECSLSCSSVAGTPGAMGGHIIFEPF